MTIASGQAATAADVLGKFVSKTGDVMGGSLTLAGDPVLPLQAATMQYVDAVSLVADAAKNTADDAATTAGTAHTAATSAVTTANAAQTTAQSALDAASNAPSKDYVDTKVATAGGDASATVVTASGSTVARTPAARASEIANALDYGTIDTTGVADSTAAILAAVATQKATVKLPAGVIRVTKRINLGGLTYSQTLMGDALGTTLLVDGSFDPTVTDGVIVCTGINQSNQRTVVRDLTIKFEQPKDIITTASAVSSAGASTVTVVSAAGVTAGMICYNRTSIGSIPTRSGGVATTIATVVSVAGNVVTLSANVLSTVAIGDSIHFAPPRSAFKTLAAGGTATQGGTGIKYPWAFYCSGQVHNLQLDNVMTIGAWNGIYIRGSGFTLGTVLIGAFNVGLDVDICFNFPYIADYRFWPWGYAPGDIYGQDRAALLSGVYYDTNTVAANLGETDGLVADNFSSWTGAVNIAANWSWGHFNNLQMDGDYANLNITSTSDGWLTIGAFYTTKSSVSAGPAILVSPTSAAFRTEIAKARVISASNSDRGITQTNGVLQISSGYMWHGLQGTRTLVDVSGGLLRLSGVDLNASTARTDTYIGVSGAATIQMDNTTFIAPAGTGAIGVSIATKNELNALRGVAWNGWGTSLPSAMPAALGVGALVSETTGTNNTAAGYKAGNAVTTGTDNTLIGQGAGLVSNGLRNSVVGSSALMANAAGNNNVAIGNLTLTAATSNNNTAVGAQAGQSVTTGSTNTFIGEGVGSTTLTTGSRNILIGVSSVIDTPNAATNDYFGLGGVGGVAFSAANLNAATPAWTMKGSFVLTGGQGFWNHAAPVSQPVAPVTLADVIAIIRGCGLSA